MKYLTSAIFILGIALCYITHKFNWFKIEKAHWNVLFLSSVILNFFGPLKWLYRPCGFFCLFLYYIFKYLNFFANRYQPFKFVQKCAKCFNLYFFPGKTFLEVLVQFEYLWEIKNIRFLWHKCNFISKRKILLAQ